MHEQSSPLKLAHLVFGRVFGSGAFVWRRVMQGSYEQVFKNVVQEGIEFYDRDQDISTALV
jgi:hypothetical protein